MDRRLKGLQIYAIDGSNLPEETMNKTEEDLVKTRSETIFRAACHMNAIYDVGARMFVDMDIQKATRKDEHSAAKRLCARVRESQDVIFIMDRYYHNFGLEYQIHLQGHFYLIRMKKRDFYSLLPKVYQDQEGEIDCTINKIFTRRKLKIHQGNDQYHYLQDKDFSGFDENGEYQAQFRLVKVKIKHQEDSQDEDDDYEYLITNLPEERFSLEEIRHLYKSSWGIETAFRELKRSIGLIAIHARKQELIHQEVWAALTLYNLSSTVIDYCQVQMEQERGVKLSSQKSLKYDW